MNNHANFKRVAAGMILAALVGFGAVVAWVFVMSWGEYFRQSLFSERQPRRTLEFTVDGEALWATYDPSLVPVTVTYRTPKGELRTESSSERASFRTLDGKPVETPMLLQGWDAHRSVLPAAGLRTHSGYFSGGIVGYLGERPPTYWYLVYGIESVEHAYFEGFDPQTKLRVGYLGTGGFRSEVPPLAEQFLIPERVWGAGSREPDIGTTGGEPRGDYDGAQYVLSGDGVYLVDFATRSASRVDLPGKVLSLGKTSKPEPKEEGSSVTYKEQTLLRLPAEIRYLDGGPAIPIPEPIRDWNLEVISTLGDDVILQAYHPRTVETQLYWIDGAGKVTRHAPLPPEKKSATGGMRWRIAIGWPMPAILAFILFVSGPLSVMSQGRADDFPSALAETLPEVWLPFAVVCLVAIVLAALTYRRHRRYSERGAAAWAVFVLLLGVPGWIGYLLHRRWPARVRCEHCGVVVPRDRATCLACAAEFPPPALRGIEVFA